jgi:hypothetical protein
MAIFLCQAIRASVQTSQPDDTLKQLKQWGIRKGTRLDTCCTEVALLCVAFPAALFLIGRLQLILIGFSPPGNLANVRPF